MPQRNFPSQRANAHESKDQRQWKQIQQTLEEQESGSHKKNQILEQAFFKSVLAMSSNQFDKRVLLKGTGMYNTHCLRKQGVRHDDN